MSRATPKMRNFSKRLIEHEIVGNKLAEKETATVFFVIEKIRPHLSTIMGNNGFRALLARSLVLANSEVKWLRDVQVKADGSLEVMQDKEVKADPDEIVEGKVLLLAHMLGLLTTFIGENLMLQIVHDVWPDLNFRNSDSIRGGDKGR